MQKLYTLKWSDPPPLNERYQSVPLWFRSVPLRSGRDVVPSLRKRISRNWHYWKGVFFFSKIHCLHACLFRFCSALSGWSWTGIMIGYVDVFNTHSFSIFYFELMFHLQHTWLKHTQFFLQFISCFTILRLGVMSYWRIAMKCLRFSQALHCRSSAGTAAAAAAAAGAVLDIAVLNTAIAVWVWLKRRCIFLLHDVR